MSLFPFFNADDVGNVDAPDAEVTGHREKRDTQEQDRVNDYVSRKHGGRRWGEIFPHRNHRLIDVETDSVHWRAEQWL